MIDVLIGELLVITRHLEAGRGPNKDKNRRPGGSENRRGRGLRVLPVLVFRVDQELIGEKKFANQTRRMAPCSTRRASLFVIHQISWA